MPAILKINPLQPDPSLIRTAVDILKQGGVVAYPTETFYGLAADCLCEKAISRLFDIKGRSFNSPIALIGSSDSDLDLITESIPETARQLMQVFWPGPLTLVFLASSVIPPRLTAGMGKIGIRISSHAIAQALAWGLGHPITATSANLSGREECIQAQAVLHQIGTQLDMIIDAGSTAGGQGSTIVDITATPPTILRQGAVSETQIHQALTSFVSPDKGLK